VRAAVAIENRYDKKDASDVEMTDKSCRDPYLAIQYATVGTSGNWATTRRIAFADEVSRKQSSSRAGWSDQYALSGSVSLYEMLVAYMQYQLSPS
jgi:hypothetical protein